MASINNTAYNTYQDYMNVPVLVVPQQAPPINHYPSHSMSQPTSRPMASNFSQGPMHAPHLSLPPLHLPQPQQMQAPVYNNETYYAPPPAPVHNMQPMVANQLPPLVQPQFVNHPVHLLPPPAPQQTISQFVNNPNVILPPPGMMITSQVQPLPQIKLKKPEEKVNGGVSETLDYDVDVMAEYVVRTSYLMFGIDPAVKDDALLQQSADQNSLEITSQKNYDLFLNGVLSVLNATRLPSTTVFLALDYMLKYLNKIPNGIDSIGGKFINVIYQNTIVSFILANKFNDDKTFTNKSWSQATGMEIDLINKYEKSWLSTFEWKLYDDKFIKYNDFIASYQKFIHERTLQQQQNIDANCYNMAKTPLSVPSPYFSSSGITTPSSAFGFQTPNLSSNCNQIFSSPCHYANDGQLNSGALFNVYNYQNQSQTQNTLNIPSLKSSPISHRFNSNEDQFNYDYYNFYDGTQDINNTQQDSYWNRSDNIASRNPVNSNYYPNYSTLY